MGVLKFRITPPGPHGLPDLRKAYVTGLDRTPERLSVDLRPGLMICQRESPESGRLSVPWRVDGFGTPVLATATLAERAEPYDLAVELARGELNDVRNQAADWVQMGLKAPPELEPLLAEARRAFAKAATARDAPAAAVARAQESLHATLCAGRVLAVAYTKQVLARRQEGGARLPTLVGCGLQGAPKSASWSTKLPEAINSARVHCTWADLEPAEGQFRWEVPDEQLSWCRKRRLSVSAGPLLEFRPAALPDWLWLWEGDFESISGLVADVIHQAVTRFKGKVACWHVVGRPASGEILGLGEDEQIRLTAKALQVAHQADPQAQLVVDLDRPWAEWMGSSPFRLGPLHLADSLARADLGLAGVGLEIAPGYTSPGGHMRNLFDFSRLLDLFALLNLPLHINLVAPSSDAEDPRADKDVRVDLTQWPTAPNEATQREWAEEWFAMAVAKPFVKSVTWLQTGDAQPHLFPHGGLFRVDGLPKPAFSWLKSFRQNYLP